MRDNLARVVFTILRQGLLDKDRVQLRKPINLEKVQADLKSKLQFSDRIDGDYLGVRYGLVSWLDEIFILHDSPWERQWSPKALEHALYDSRDRAWKFWEQARMASARSDADALEAYYLAMLLGFRGELDGKPADLADWRDLIEGEIGLKRQEEWPDMPHRLKEQSGDLPRSGAKERLRWLFLGIALFLGLFIPVAAFLLASLPRL